MRASGDARRSKDEGSWGEGGGEVERDREQDARQSISAAGNEGPSDG